MAKLSLNYQGLLALPSAQAFAGAVSQALGGLDLTYWETYYGVSLGIPTADGSSVDPHDTLCPVIYTNPCQDPSNEPLAYSRLNLGEYMACCQRYLTSDDIATSGTLANWFISKHGVYFDQPDLSIAAPAVDPERDDRQQVVITVADGNYVWYGQATLYLVDSTHLALLAYPGTAKGLQWSDVLWS